jgi:hypothetical protein
MRPKQIRRFCRFLFNRRKAMRLREIAGEVDVGDGGARIAAHALITKVEDRRWWWVPFLMSARQRQKSFSGSTTHADFAHGLSA